MFYSFDGSSSAAHHHAPRSERCGNCNGTGRVMCWGCMSSGRIYTTAGYERCNSCSGSGSHYCPNCLYGQV